MKKTVIFLGISLTTAALMAIAPGNIVPISEDSRTHAVHAAAKDDKVTDPRIGKTIMNVGIQPEVRTLYPDKNKKNNYNGVVYRKDAKGTFQQVRGESAAKAYSQNNVISVHDVHGISVGTDTYYPLGTATNGKQKGEVLYAKNLGYGYLYNHADPGDKHYTINLFIQPQKMVSYYDNAKSQKFNYDGSVYRRDAKGLFHKIGGKTAIDTYPDSDPISAYNIHSITVGTDTYYPLGTATNDAQKGETLYAKNLHYGYLFKANVESASKNVDWVSVNASAAPNLAVNQTTQDQYPVVSQIRNGKRVVAYGVVRDGNTYYVPANGVEINPSISLTTATKIVPATPLRPSKKVIPATPLKPAKKVIPATPLKPAKKVVPATPLKPSKKVIPATPLKPAKKVVPATPLTPSKKVIPATPLTPAKKVVPATPLTPSKKVIPTTPLTPAKKVIPATPLTPSKKVVPATPLTPSKKVVPATPLTPSKKVVPATPLTPAKKVVPATPLTPAKKVVPATPLTPAKKSDVKPATSLTPTTKTDPKTTTPTPTVQTQIEKKQITNL